MSHFIGPLLGLLIAYLCGSIPMALLLGKSKGIDIRSHGSGNVGATNVFRVMGKGWGLGCLLFDIFKGWAPAMALSGAQWARAFWRPDAVDEYARRTNGHGRDGRWRVRAIGRQH